MKVTYFYDPRLTKIGEQYQMSIYQWVLGKKILERNVICSSYDKTLMLTKEIVNNLNKYCSSVSLFDAIGLIWK